MGNRIVGVECYYGRSFLGEIERYHLNYRHYSSVSHYSSFWNYLQENISSVRSKTVYSGSIYASMSFKQSYLRAIDYHVLNLAFIQLIEQYAYNIESEYVKITIGYSMLIPSNSLHLL